jgi:arginine/ornithine transport system substrate-binding protein
MRPTRRSSRSRRIGTLVGFDVDPAHAVCAEMKVKCTLVNVGWDGLIPGLVAKKHDSVWASLNITDERKKVVDFSDSYYRMQNRFVAKKGREHRDQQRRFEG